MFNYLFVLCCIFSTWVLVAQQKDTLKNIEFTGYAEVYAGYDFSTPKSKERPAFIYNHKRNRELNLNLMLLKASYSDKRIRASLAFMMGDYVTYNLSGEPNWAKFINECSLGFKLSKKHKLWADTGIFPSHIGFESAISKDCWTLTRSILAENSPYYESGIKLNYSGKKDKWNTTFLILNGWQRISFPTTNFLPALGLQVSYKSSQKFSLNYSNFIGKVIRFQTETMRTYHNIYMQYEPTKKNGIIAGFDLGTEKNTLNHAGLWFSPVIIFRHTFSNKWKLALRSEYYNDKQQLIITTNTPNGFKVFGSSMNWDFQLNKHIIFRVEGKWFHSTDLLFNSSKNQRVMLTGNMTLSF